LRSKRGADDCENPDALRRTTFTQKNYFHTICIEDGKRESKFILYKAKISFLVYNGHNAEPIDKTLCLVIVRFI